MGVIRKLYNLLPSERLILAQAWCFFVLSGVALRVLSFKYLLGLIQKPYSNNRNMLTSQTDLSSFRLAWLVTVAGRYSPVDATCLQHALVLCWLLGKQGFAASLQIGVAREQGSLVAHAWVEQNGQILIGQDGIEKFHVLLQTR